MANFLVTLDHWWLENPLAVVFIGILAAVLLVLLLLPVAIFSSPRMRIYYRAVRCILWVKIGTSRESPPLPRLYRQHLDSKRLQRLLMSTEGAAFGRTGVLFLTTSEIGFLSVRFGVITETNLPFAQISEAMISKRALYDCVTVTTGERAEVLRIYRAGRDVGQEFFHHLQMRLGAMRFRK